MKQWRLVYKKDLPDEFELIKMDHYLEKYLKTDPIFLFSKEDSEVKISIDSPDWDNFFREKETM